METTKVSGAFRRSSETTLETSLRVPMPLSKNRIAMVHSVVFIAQLWNVFEGQRLVMVLLGKSSEPGAELNDDIVQRFFNRPDFIAYWEKRLIVQTSGVMMEEVVKQIDIPGPGLPVANDLSLLVDVSLTTQTPVRIGCYVYYTDHEVSMDEWIKLAKRSVNVASEPQLRQVRGIIGAPGT